MADTSDKHATNSDRQAFIDAIARDAALEMVKQDRHSNAVGGQMRVIAGQAYLLAREMWEARP